MRDAKLTKAASAAHSGGMSKSSKMRWRAMMLFAGSIMLGACVTVNAPSEPIVIELNINITQEVIYRLAEDAGQAIDENADIF